MSEQQTDERHAYQRACHTPHDDCTCMHLIGGLWCGRPRLDPIHAPDGRALGLLPSAEHAVASLTEAMACVHGPEFDSASWENDCSVCYAVRPLVEAIQAAHDDEGEAR